MGTTSQRTGAPLTNGLGGSLTGGQAPLTGWPRSPLTSPGGHPLLADHRSPTEPEPSARTAPHALSAALSPASPVPDGALTEGPRHEDPHHRRRFVRRRRPVHRYRRRPHRRRSRRGDRHTRHLRPARPRRRAGVPAAARRSTRPASGRRRSRYRARWSTGPDAHRRRVHRRTGGGHGRRRRPGHGTPAALHDHRPARPPPLRGARHPRAGPFPPTHRTHKGVRPRGVRRAEPGPLGQPPRGSPHPTHRRPAPRRRDPRPPRPPRPAARHPGRRPPPHRGGPAAGAARFQRGPAATARRLAPRPRRRRQLVALARPRRPTPTRPRRLPGRRPAPGLHRLRQHGVRRGRTPRRPRRTGPTPRQGPRHPPVGQRGPDVPGCRTRLLQRRPCPHRHLLRARRRHQHRQRQRQRCSPYGALPHARQGHHGAPYGNPYGARPNRRASHAHHAHRVRRPHHRRGPARPTLPPHRGGGAPRGRRHLGRRAPRGRPERARTGHRRPAVLGRPPGHTGGGHTPIPFADLSDDESADRLASALIRATTEPTHRTRANGAARRMEAEDGIAAVVSAVARLAD